MIWFLICFRQVCGYSETHVLNFFIVMMFFSTFSTKYFGLQSLYNGMLWVCKDVQKHNDFACRVCRMVSSDHVLVNVHDTS